CIDDRTIRGCGNECSEGVHRAQPSSWGAGAELKSLLTFQNAVRDHISRLNCHAHPCQKQVQSKPLKRKYGFHHSFVLLSPILTIKSQWPDFPKKKIDISWQVSGRMKPSRFENGFPLPRTLWFEPNSYA